MLFKHLKLHNILSIKNIFIFSKAWLWTRSDVSTWVWHCCHEKGEKDDMQSHNVYRNWSVIDLKFNLLFVDN